MRLCASQSPFANLDTEEQNTNSLSLGENVMGVSESIVSSCCDDNHTHKDFAVAFDFERCVCGAGVGPQDTRPKPRAYSPVRLGATPLDTVVGARVMRVRCE